MQPVKAHEFLIDSQVAANPGQYGVMFDLYNANLTVNTGNFVINSAGPAPALTIRYLSIKPGQRWENLRIDASNVIILLTGPNGEVLVPQTPVFGVQVFDISDKKAAQNGEVLTLQIWPTSFFNQVNSIRFEYTGKAALLCYPSPWTPGKGNLQLSYELAGEARVSLKIYDNTGRLVAIIRNEELLPARQYSKQNDTWSGHSLNGGLVSSGVYHAVLQVKYLKYLEDSLSSYESSFRFVVAR